MSKSGAAPSAPLTRKQRSRAERDRRQHQFIVVSALVVTALVVGVIAFGVIDQAVLRPRQVVARVGDEQITKGEFVKAARFQRYNLIAQLQQVAQAIQLFGQQEFFNQQLTQIQTALSDKATLGREVINNLVDDRLIRAEAARRGIAVSAEDVKKAYQEFFGFYPDGTPTPTITPSATLTPTLQATATVDPTRAATLTAAPTLTPTATLQPTATFTPTLTHTPTATSTPGPSPTPTSTGTPRPTATPYTTQGYGTAVAGYERDVRQQTGLSDAEILRMLEGQLYRKRLEAAIGAEVPATEEQVHARHILVPDLVSAEAVLRRLSEGEDFAALAAEVSTDTATKDLGGDLGWFGRGAMVAAFEEAAFSLPIGQVSQPVQTDFGFHVIEVLERAERPLDPDTLATRRQAALTDWLTAQRSATMPDGRLLVEIFDNWLADVPDRPAVPASLLQ
ncbi:MAG: peptidylprolyl isomerase [Anaerolineales bacterium]|nr:peptidylprolyl isomerase [Anaerolineales bacterium]